MHTDNFLFVRGGRILNQLKEQAPVLLERSTADQLEQNIRTAWPTTRKRQNATNEVNVRNVEYIPYIGTKMLHARSQTISNGNPHKQAIQFLNINFAGVDSPDVVTFKATDGTDTSMVPIDLSTHNVKCRCDCLDFRFRFANYNSSDQTLIGKPPPPYQRKTETRPPVNPMQVPGVCKHILKVIDRMRSEGLIL